MSKRTREFIERSEEAILTDEECEEIYSTSRTADVILDEIEHGLINLALNIEKLDHFYEGSEIKGVTQKRESSQGEDIKKAIKQWTEYVQERIDNIGPLFKTEFDTAVSETRTENINIFTANVQKFKNNIMKKNKVIANNEVVPPESNEILRDCLAYNNLLTQLNNIKKHNDYFKKLVPPRLDQVIEEVDVS
jgi:gas vesicle protein